jgi:hypothetical protein
MLNLTHSVTGSPDDVPRTLANLHAEQNAQNLKIARYAACAHKRATIAVDR